MTRRTSIAGATIAAAVLALVATNASAAPGHDNRTPGNHATHDRSVSAASTMTSAAATAATSLGLIGLNDNRTEVFQALSGGSPTKLGLVGSKFTEDIDGTAIDTSGANALIATDTGAVASISNPRTRPRFGQLLRLSQFGGEGAADFNFFSEGVAIRGSSALVTSDEGGVVQLISKSGTWRVDARVHFPGTTGSGFPRARGFIPFPETAGEDDEYNGIAISPTALSNGKYLAVSIDHGESKLAVIEGVGTATPKVATLSDPSLDFDSTFGPDEGNGGVAFSPATPARAVVATATGFAVLNLSHPMHPKLQSPTVVGTADDAESIGVSPDGRFVVEAVADTAYIYSGLLTTAPATPLTPVSTIDPGDSLGAIFDVAFLANGILAVVHGDPSNGFKLTMYKAATTATPTIADSAPLAAQPETSNTLSVWPSIVPPSLHPRRLLHHARVGKHVHKTLSVVHGIGSYTFKVTKGKLPKGLKRHGATISGKPRASAAGKFHFTITAISQFGEGIVRTYKGTIKPKKKHRSSHHARVSAVG
jgi:hypothetical protein